MKRMDYKKVIADYASGAIDRNKWKLVIDNDDGYWDYCGPEVPDETVDKLRAGMNAKYGKPWGYQDMVEVLTAAGVNAECV